MDIQTPTPTNDPVSHVLGHMAFMMSVIRSGESLTEPEFDGIRKDMGALRAEVERLRGELEDALKASGANAKAWQDCVEESAIKRTHLMAEISLTEQRAEAAESTAAGLRRALEEIRDNSKTCAGAQLAAHAALAASPDEHERRIKAEALKEMARLFMATAKSDLSYHNRDLAARFCNAAASELEAANGR